jgi:hypothetical protein
VKVRNETLSERFSSANSEDFIILVTERFEPNMMLLRRADCAVSWEPFTKSGAEFLNVKEAQDRCDSLDLFELRTAIDNLNHQSRILTWPIVDSTQAQTVSNDSDTTVGTTASFKEWNDEETEAEDANKFWF